MSLRDEPTIPVTVRIPEPLMQRAMSRAPGSRLSAVVRMALAAWIGDDPIEYAGMLRPGPKPREPR